jgi:hypothetical protein
MKVRARHPVRVVVTRLIGVLVALLVLTLFIPTINKTRWRPADLDIENATPADSIEIDDLRESGQVNGYSRIVTDREAITATLQEVRNAPGKWKRGLFREPDGYLFFVFLKRTMGPPGYDPLLLLRVAHGFLIHGSNGQWEYKYISQELEAKLSALGPGVQERKP